MECSYNVSKVQTMDIQQVPSAVRYLDCDRNAANLTTMSGVHTSHPSLTHKLPVKNLQCYPPPRNTWVIFRVFKDNYIYWKNRISDPKYMTLDAYAAEFAGTLVLVVMMCLCVFIRGYVLAPLSIGVSITCLIYALASVSGAHFNPAITYALWLYDSRLMDAVKSSIYITAQYVGATVAGLLIWRLSGKTYMYTPTHGHTLVEAFIVESLFSMILVLVILSLTLTPSKTFKGSTMHRIYGIAAGLTVMVATYACINISGGALNPAVSSGLLYSFVLNHGYGGLSVFHCVPYWIGPYIGASLAVGIYRLWRRILNAFDGGWTSKREDQQILDIMDGPATDHNAAFKSAHVISSTDKNIRKEAAERLPLLLGRSSASVIPNNSGRESYKMGMHYSKIDPSKVPIGLNSSNQLSSAHSTSKASSLYTSQSGVQDHGVNQSLSGYVFDSSSKSIDGSYGYGTNELESSYVHVESETLVDYTQGAFHRLSEAATSGKSYFQSNFGGLSNSTTPNDCYGPSTQLCYV